MAAVFCFGVCGGRDPARFSSFFFKEKKKETGRRDEEEEDEAGRKKKGKKKEKKKNSMEVEGNGHRNGHPKSSDQCGVASAPFRPIRRNKDERKRERERERERERKW